MINVAITGLGAVSPLGLTVADMWAGLSAGRCGISRIAAFDPSGFPCQIAGQVPDFKVQQFVPKSFRKSIKLMSRDIELAVVAADEAIRASGLITAGIDQEKINVDPKRFAINLGAAFVSCDLVELAPAISASVTDGKFDIRKWGKDGLPQVTPLWLLKYLPNMFACHIGIIHDIQGPSNTVTCGEAASHIAIAEASQVIARGSADIALAGGSEAKLSPFLIARQCLVKRANVQDNDRPETACRPFDADAKGAVFGEGAAVIVLENAEHAKKRGAKILALIAGTGQSCSLNPVYEYLESDGKGVKMAIENAMTDAGVAPQDIDLVIPHGIGLARDDAAEARGIEAALGTCAATVPVWPTKSMLSVTGAASGVIDIAAAVCAIRDNLIPAARNCGKKINGCNLNIVTQPIRKEIRCVLCCGYTYGGQTAAIVLKNSV